MYPSRELAALALRKVAVRQRIAVARWDCVASATEASRPLAWIDGAVVQWRKISPFAKFAAVPLGFIFGRRLMPAKGGIFRQLLRWAPVALKAVQLFKARQR